MTTNLHAIPAKLSPKVADIHAKLAADTYDEDAKFDKAADLMIDSHDLTKAAALCAVVEVRIGRTPTPLEEARHAKANLPDRWAD